MSLVIRPWTVADRIYVVPMLFECLVEAEKDGNDIAGTPQNAETLWGMGVVAAQAGDPVLLALDESKDLLGAGIGFVLWVPPATTLQFRDRLLFGFGTYVKPSHRRSGVSKQLREHAVALAKAQGYARVVGVGHSDAGVKSATAVGFRPYGVAGELSL